MPYPASDESFFSRIRETKRACHIKLGQAGSLAKQCFDEGKLYIGYFTGSALLPLLRAPNEQNWNELRERIKDNYPDKQGALTSAINQVKSVVEDDGYTLWFTFDGAKMYWTYVDASVPLQIWEGKGTFRKTIGWRSTNMAGSEILEGHVTTRISQVRAYQGTVRAYPNQPDKNGFNPVEYLRNLILDVPQPSTDEAKKSQRELISTVEKLIVRLTYKEFENFIDLIFVGDGWQRVTEVGGQMADIDGLYEHATSGATAMVQCKSSISIGSLDENAMMETTTPSTAWIFWAYHTARDSFEQDVGNKYGTSPDTPSWHRFPNKDSDGRLYLLGRRRLAGLAVRKGLVGWLIRKAC